MVYKIRKISGDKTNPLVLSKETTTRPSEFRSREKSSLYDDRQRLDPHRALFAQFHHPGSKLLIAKKLPPNEKKWVAKGLIEQAFYEMENMISD